MKTILISLLILLALSGCTITESLFGPLSKEVEVGWSRAQVIKNEGKPAWSWRDGNSFYDVFQFNGNDVLHVEYDGTLSYRQEGNKYFIWTEWKVKSFYRIMSGYRQTVE